MGHSSSKNQEKEQLCYEENSSEEEESSLSEFFRYNDSEHNLNGVSVTWQNLTVTADIKETHMFTRSTHHYKEIIHNVTGAIHPGNLVAILGASGSGKTTLMSTLANRSPGGLIVNGDIKIGGRKIGNFMKDISGYVYQEDLFAPSLTVIEHLNFIAMLKLDRKVNSKARKELVKDVLYEVGLQNCANRFLGKSSHGNSKSNLSGGERKRLSVATELLTNPPLLFCDEPTTGLDSYSALKLVTVLRDMATVKNKTIICSIHQPSEQLFQLFHQIILLTSGRIAFMGSYKDAVSYFQSVGYCCSEDQNPAEFLVKSLAVTPGEEDESLFRSKEICDRFKSSKYYSPISSYIKNETEKFKHRQPISVKHHESPLWIYKLFVMTHRTFLNVFRDYSIQMVHIIEKMIMGLVLGLCVRGSVVPSQYGIQALEGILFLLITENFFPSIYHIMDHFPTQMPIFYREQSNGINTTLIFLLSNILSLLPGSIFSAVLYTSVVYWLAELLPDMYSYILTCAIAVFVSIASSGFGMMLSTVCGSQTLASIITIPIDNACMILSGIYISLKSLPPYVMWTKNLSWFRYGCEAMFIIQLRKSDHIACQSNPNLPCLRSGKEVLDRHGYHESNLWPNIMYLINFYVIFNLITYLSLRVRSKLRTI